MKRITPFSNGTDYMIWNNMNCSECNMYESESTERKNAKCKKAFDIDLALVTDGKIPLKTAELIGYKNGQLQNCNFKNIEFKKVIINTEVFNELTLF